MRKIKLEEIQRLVETQNIEFKKSPQLRKEAMKALTAMVNADVGQGTVIFGIDDSGNIVGIGNEGLDGLQKSLAEHIRDKFSPKLMPTIEIVECDGHNLLIVTATRSPSIPLFEYDGRAFVRTGSTMTQLNLSEKLGLIKDRDRNTHPGPWRCSKCKAFAGIVSSVTVTDKGAYKTFDHSCGGEWVPA